jgi:hypothetical protein
MSNLCEKVLPMAIGPDSKAFSLLRSFNPFPEVTVWGALSSFLQTTVVPGLICKGLGENALLPLVVAPFTIDICCCLFKGRIEVRPDIASSGDNRRPSNKYCGYYYTYNNHLSLHDRSMTVIHGAMINDRLNKVKPVLNENQGIISVPRYPTTVPARHSCPALSFLGGQGDLLRPYRSKRGRT